MRFVLTGGGTGGHIYPALAIAKGIQEKYSGAEILYIGTKHGLEASIVPRAGFPFASISLSGLQRKLALGNLRVLWQAAAGTVGACRLIKDFKPCIVVGTGGYVCGPVVMAAAFLRVPTLIHEQNALPGITNRALSRFAGRVAVTFADSMTRFPARSRVLLTGLPVRPEIKTADREKARAELGLTSGQTFVLSFGGSQGARSINYAMPGVIKNFENEKSIKFLHITGPSQYEDFLTVCKRENVKLDQSPDAHHAALPYLHEMPQVLAAADIVVCRAGAATLAEITVRGLPSILIPYPYAAENHQEYNARALADQGAAEMVLDRELNSRLLTEKIKKMVRDRDYLKEMSSASLALGRPQALDDILGAVDELIAQGIGNTKS